MSLIPYKRNAEVEKNVLEELLKGTSLNQSPDNNTGSVPYKDITFEAVAYRKANATGKELVTYDVSLARLQKAGFKRHVRSTEVFSLLADNLENKLSGNLKKLAEDMLVSYGELLSLGFEREGDKLFVYVDLEGLTWNGSKYVKQKNFKYGDKKEFDITGKKSGVWIDLSTFDDAFVKLVYGRAFKDLPKKMQDRAHVALPTDGDARPVGCGNYGNYYDVDCNYGGASRGVC